MRAQYPCVSQSRKLKITMKEPQVFRKMSPNVDPNTAVLPGFPSTLNFAPGQAVL